MLNLIVKLSFYMKAFPWTVGSRCINLVNLCGAFSSSSRAFRCPYFQRKSLKVMQKHDNGGDGHDNFLQIIKKEKLGDT